MSNQKKQQKTVDRAKELAGMVLDSGILNNDAMFKNYLRSKERRPAGIAVGSSDWHRLVNGLGKLLNPESHQLTKSQRKKLAFICEGGRVFTEEDCRHGKWGGDAARKFAKGQRVSVGFR